MNKRIIIIIVIIIIIIIPLHLMLLQNSLRFLRSEWTTEEWI